MQLSTSHTVTGCFSSLRRVSSSLSRSNSGWVSPCARQTLQQRQSQLPHTTASARVSDAVSRSSPASGPSQDAPSIPSKEEQQHQPSVASGSVSSSDDGDSGSSSSASVLPPETPAQKARQLTNRVIFGSVLGFAGAALIVVGNYCFLILLLLVIYQGTQEYFGMITSKGIAKGMRPPAPFVTSLTSLLCISMALISFYYTGRSSSVLAVASFLLLVMQVLTIKKPKFAQMASTIFGLFYCGWLPSFWIKLRMLAAPAPVTSFSELIAKVAPWNIGMLATFTSVVCIIAADTGAYFVGRSLGKHKLTDISPKKTWEGAFGGLISSVAVSLGVWKATKWPSNPVEATGLGVLVFFSSLFGDLIESIMKRDAGVKDSGNLIPGHGGLLDRFDSYMFSGAVTYFYLAFVLQGFGRA